MEVQHEQILETYNAVPDMAVTAMRAARGCTTLRKAAVAAAALLGATAAGEVGKNILRVVHNSPE